LEALGAEESKKHPLVEKGKLQKNPLTPSQPQFFIYEALRLYANYVIDNYDSTGDEVLQYRFEELTRAMGDIAYRAEREQDVYQYAPVIPMAASIFPFISRPHSVPRILSYNFSPALVCVDAMTHYLDKLIDEAEQLDPDSSEYADLHTCYDAVKKYQVKSLQSIGISESAYRASFDKQDA